MQILDGGREGALIRNLSSHLASNERIAQDLMFQGRANKRIAETPMNHNSSRSHTIFTIIQTTTAQDTPTITRQVGCTLIDSAFGYSFGY